ncbi:MAG: hypothetical protein AAGK02_11550, partial [Pseudomonadota bacterium]
LSGDARTQFKRNGGTYTLRNAYDAELKSSWLVGDRPGIGFEDAPTVQTWENTVEIIAQIRCAPLDPNAGATRTNPDPVPTRTNPPASDPSTLPRLKTATLRIAPSHIQTVNGFRCPTKLQLYGFIETNRRMRGKVIFVGPAYLSAPKDFDFDGAKTMNHRGTYDLRWGANAQGTLAQGASTPSRQDLTFKFNVVNGRGRLVKTVEESIRVTCE